MIQYSVRCGTLLMTTIEKSQTSTRSMFVEEVDELIKRAKSGEKIFVTHRCMIVDILDVLSQINNRTKGD